MRRYQLILGGTLTGIAGVLAFPTTRSSHLTIPSASAGTSASSTSSSSPGSLPGTAATGSVTSTTAASTTSTTPRSATSADETFRYGDLAVTVTVDGSKVTNVKMATLNETDSRSSEIDHYAVPQLEQQVISANSANIHGVSGATFTSEAFVNAVTNAFDKLGFKG
jgi:uncharacterized protein with FMN-binding domain